MVADDFCANGSVALHHVPLARRQRPWLEQHAVGDADLADIVHRRDVQDQVGLGFVQAGGKCDEPRVVGHPDHVQAGLIVAVLGGAAQPLDNF
jgi:hypothetical protein